MTDEPDVSHRVRSFHLQGTNGELTGLRFPIRDGLTLGRSSQSDVFLPDRRLCRTHARIEWKSTFWELVDCSRRTGISVNGVTAATAVIQAGDLIELGRFALRCDVDTTLGHSPGGLIGLAPLHAGECSNTESGCALAVRLIPGAVNPGVLHAVQSLRETVSARLSRRGGVLSPIDPFHWRMAWPGDGDAPTRGVAVALEIQRLAFAERLLPDLLGIACGIGTGPLWRMGDEQAPWMGDACDQAIRFALAARADEILLSDANGAARGVRGLIWRSPDHRQTYRLARPVLLASPSESRRALLLRVTQSKLHPTLAVTLGTTSPIETGVTVRCHFETFSTAMTCRECRPVNAGWWQSLWMAGATVVDSLPAGAFLEANPGPALLDRRAA